jgi:hypothetical protein
MVHAGGIVDLSSARRTGGSSLTAGCGRLGCVCARCGSATFLRGNSESKPSTAGDTITPTKINSSASDVGTVRVFSFARQQGDRGTPWTSGGGRDWAVQTVCKDDDVDVAPGRSGPGTVARRGGRPTARPLRLQYACICASVARGRLLSGGWYAALGQSGRRYQPEFAGSMNTLAESSNQIVILRPSWPCRSRRRMGQRICWHAFLLRVTFVGSRSRRSLRTEWRSGTVVPRDVAGRLCACAWHLAVQVLLEDVAIAIFFVWGGGGLE